MFSCCSACSPNPPGSQIIHPPTNPRRPGRHSRERRRGEEKSSPSTSPLLHQNPPESQSLFQKRSFFSGSIQIQAAIYSVWSRGYASSWLPCGAVDLRESNSPAGEGGRRAHGRGGEAAVRESAQRPVAGRSRHPAGVARGLRRRAPPRHCRFAEEVRLMGSCLWCPSPMCLFGVFLSAGICSVFWTPILVMPFICFSFGSRLLVWVGCCFHP